MKTTLAALVLALPSLALADSGLGNKDPGLYNLKGTIYFLDDGAGGMPDDLDKRKTQGVVYTDRLDVPTRDFKEGFPGVTDRLEWFGLVYTGSFQVTRPGDYQFTLRSDDGSRLWIDGKQVIDNDGQHATQDNGGTVKLGKGQHAIKVWYFQGPMYEIALQLFVQPPGASERKIFAMSDFAAGLTDAATKLGAQATPQGIKVNLDAAVLFDTAKWQLKPGAKKQLAQVAQLIRAYPNARVEVSGHTDSVGDDASNMTLSEKRAASVKAALVGDGVPSSVTLETHGYGKTQPIDDNGTEKGRAKNRRVEILIHP